MFSNQIKKIIIPYKKIFFLILPIILSAFLQNLVGAIDNFMVAKIDPNQKNALTAVGLVSQIILFSIAIFWSINAIASIFSNQFVGAKQFINFKNTIKINFLFNFIIVVLVAIILWTLGPQIIDFFLRSSAQNQKIKSLAKPYLEILTGSLFFVALSCCLIQPIIIIGKPKYYLYVGLFSLLNNITFNLVFVYVFHLGIVGIAWSTFLARICEFLLLWFFVIFRFRKQLLFKLNFYFDRKIIKAFMTKIIVATSFMVQFLSYALFTIVYMRNYDASVQSSLGISNAIIGILFSIIPGIVLAIMVFVGQALGANKFDLAQDYVKKIYRLVLVLSLVFSSFAIILVWIIVPLVITDYQNITYMVSLYCAFMIVLITNFVLSTALRAGGFAVLPIIFNQYLRILISFPIVYFLVTYTKIDFKIAYLIPLCVDFVICGILYILYRQKRWVRNITGEFKSHNRNRK